MLSRQIKAKPSSSVRSSFSRSSRRPCSRLRIVAKADQVDASATEAVVLDKQVEYANGAPQCPVKALKQLSKPVLNRWDSFWLYSKDPVTFVKRTYNGQPMARGYFFGVIPAIFVGSVEGIKEAVALEPSGEIWQGWPKPIRTLLGELAVTMSDTPARYRSLRQIMAPALSSDMVDSYLPEIHHICKEYLDHWVSTTSDGKMMPVMPQMKNMTFKIITAVVMDLKLSQEEFQVMNKDFVDLIAGLFVPFAVEVWPHPYYFGVQARKRIVARLLEKVRAVRAEVAADAAAGLGIKYKSSMKCFVTATDDAGNTMTDEEIVDNLIVLLFAGHDTTASQLTATMYQMAKRPEMLDRVRAEQQQIIAKHGHDMTPAALKDMTYTQAVLQEVLRWQPPVTNVFRRSYKDVAVGGYAVPSDETVILGLSRTIKTDPRWPADGSPDSNPLHPDNFNPDRFMSPEGQKQGAQVPFGVGMHTCAGISLAQAEVKIFLATLAREYSYTADVNTKYIPIPIPKPENQLPIVMKKLAAPL